MFSFKTFFIAVLSIHNNTDQYKRCNKFGRGCLVNKSFDCPHYLLLDYCNRGRNESLHCTHCKTKYIMYNCRQIYFNNCVLQLSTYVKSNLNFSSMTNACSRNVDNTRCIFFTMSMSGDSHFVPNNLI